MRALSSWALTAALLVPAFQGFAAAPPDDGVSAAAAASTPEEGAAQGEQAAAEDSQQQELEARLTAVSGPVYVHLVDHKDGDYTEAETDMPVSAGDEIRVGDKGSAELTLDGHTVIQLGADSDFVVNSLAPSATEFHLGLGSLVAKIKHLVEGRRMEFHTPTAVAAVRGTELGVSQGEGSEPARVGVFDEGNVAVRGEGKEGEVRLGPNQEAQIEKGKPIAKPAPLSWWQQSRARIVQARARQQQMLKSWRPRPLAQRRRLRQSLLQRPALQRGQLKGLSPQQRARQYGMLRARQEALRRQARADRQQRQRAMQRQQNQQRQLQQRRENRQRANRQRTQLTPQRQQQRQQQQRQQQAARQRQQQQQEQRRQRGFSRGGRRR